MDTKLRHKISYIKAKMCPTLKGTINVVLPCTLHKCTSNSCQHMPRICWTLVRVHWDELGRETEGREQAGKI